MAQLTLAAIAAAPDLSLLAVGIVGKLEEKNGMVGSSGKVDDPCGLGG